MHGEEALAEDVVKNVLGKAIDKPDTYCGEAALYAWLCTFCRHEISAVLRRSNREPVDLIEDLPSIRATLESLIDSSAAPERGADRAELGIVNTPGGPQPGVVPGERNANRNNDYLRVDIRVSRAVSLERGTFTCFFEIYNVFDTDNTCCVDEKALLPGQSLRINNRAWLPRMPLFGFSWTFEQDGNDQNWLTSGMCSPPAVKSRTQVLKNNDIRTFVAPDCFPAAYSVSCRCGGNAVIVSFARS